MKAITCLIIITVFCSCICYSKEEVPKVGDLAPDFTLQDPKEKQYNLKKLRGSVVFLIMGNRKVRKEDDKWAEAFQKNYKENPKISAFIVADLRSVPGFIPKRFILSQLKRNPPPVPFLLDWKGQVHQRYHTDKKKPNLYLISPDGKIIFHRKAIFTLDNFAEFKKQVDLLIAQIL